MFFFIWPNNFLLYTAQARYAEIKEVTRQNNKKMRDHTESMLQKAEDRYNERNAHIQRMVKELHVLKKEVLRSRTSQHLLGL